MNYRAHIEAVLAIIIIVSGFWACAHVPIPTGGSINETEAGTSTCIDWARKNCPSCLDGGVQLYDAGYGL